jgi:hypothetical protein
MLVRGEGAEARETARCALAHPHVYSRTRRRGCRQDIPVNLAGPGAAGRLMASSSAACVGMFVGGVSGARVASRGVVGLYWSSCVEGVPVVGLLFFCFACLFAFSTRELGSAGKGSMVANLTGSEAAAQFPLADAGVTWEGTTTTNTNRGPSTRARDGSRARVCETLSLTGDGPRRSSHAPPARRPQTDPDAGTYPLTWQGRGQRAVFFPSILRRCVWGGVWCGVVRSRGGGV